MVPHVHIVAWMQTLALVLVASLQLMGSRSAVDPAAWDEPAGVEEPEERGDELELDGPAPFKARLRRLLWVAAAVAAVSPVFVVLPLAAAAMTPFYSVLACAVMPLTPALGSLVAYGVAIIAAWLTLPIGPWNHSFACLRNGTVALACCMGPSWIAAVAVIPVAALAGFYGTFFVVTQPPINSTGEGGIAEALVLTFVAGAIAAVVATLAGIAAHVFAALVGAFAMTVLTDTWWSDEVAETAP